MSTEPKQKQLASQEIDYIKILRILLSRWYWIVACVLIALAVAKVYLWYTPPVYSTSAKLKFDEKKSEISELLKVSNVYDRTNRVESETFVIRSYAIIANAVKRLDYKVSYFLKGRIRTTEVYPNKPFPVEIIKQDSVDFYRGLIDIQNLGNNKIELSYNGENKTVYQVGQPIQIPGVLFRIKSVPASRSVYSIKFNTIDDFVGRAAGGLGLEPATKTSNILFLSQQDQNRQFAADILNAIAEEYVSYDGRQRSQSASQTIDFIDTQLAYLAGKVSQSGDALEGFKSSRGIVDLGTNTQMNVTKVSELEAQLNILKIEEVSINQLEQQVNNNKDRIEFNYSLGGNVDPLLAPLLAQWNKLLGDRQAALQRFTENSQPVQEIDKQIAETRRSIVNNIQLARDRNKKTQQYINTQIGSARQSLSSLPSAERDFINLQTDFNINQKVFSYLSEKKLEAQISKAAVVAGSSIVEYAPTAYALVRPIPREIYSTAFMAGLIVGVGLIILVRLSNPFIYDKETVENLTTTPIIGVIRRFPVKMDHDNRQILSLARPKSIFAESVRSVRTNLSFLASEKKSKVICITSEVSGEGKSFISVNLASTLALIDKRVIIIATDLRRSKLHKTFNVDNSSGLSTYLSGQTARESLILNTEVENLHFIPSGPVPPNPSELLHTRKMKELIAEFREIYDYILIDTAPVGLVSDAIPIIRQADVNIFVLRAGVSKYQAATIPERLTQEYNLRNIVIILNAFGDDALHSRYYSTNYAKSNNSYYYYSDYSGYAGSGYYTDEDKAKWWQFWKLFKK